MTRIGAMAIKSLVTNIMVARGSGIIEGRQTSRRR